MRAQLRRQGRRLGKRARGVAVASGALPYRPVASVAPTVWDTRYTGDALDHFANAIESARSAVLAEFLAHLGGKPAILDVGCGVGLFRTRLGASPFSRYVGIDVSAVAIGRAGALADGRTEFQVAARPTPALGSFDVVVANEVIYCAPDPAAFLDDIATVLEPGGHLLASIWRHPGDTGLHRLIDDRFEPVHAVEVRNLSEPRHRWRVSCHRRPGT